jgi:hypothetical protein
MIGAGRTVAVKAHVSARFCASAAMHVTLVVPTGIGAPLDGVHATETGAVPPVTVGAA